MTAGRAEGHLFDTCADAASARWARVIYKVSGPTTTLPAIFDKTQPQTT